jgi:GNAT superfamily N-acetyltransferase
LRVADPAIDDAERSFWRGLWNAVPADVAAEHGVALRDFGPIQVTTARDLADVPMLNLGLGADTPEAVADGHLERAVAWIESVGVRAYVPVRSGAGGAPAGRWFQRHGYERGYAWMKFIRDARPPEGRDPPGVEVVELTEPSETLGAIVAAGFGLPAWTGAFFGPLAGHEAWGCYLALVDGVGQGAAMMHRHGDVAEIGAAATLPEARGRGCQTALLHRRIRDAAAAGCRVMTVETGERTGDRPSASYRNILRAGFEEAGLRPNWRVGPAA